MIIGSPAVSNGSLINHGPADRISKLEFRLDDNWLTCGEHSKLVSLEAKLEMLVADKPFIIEHRLRAKRAGPRFINEPWLTRRVAGHRSFREKGVEHATTFNSQSAGSRCPAGELSHLESDGSEYRDQDLQTSPCWRPAPG